MDNSLEFANIRKNFVRKLREAKHTSRVSPPSPSDLQKNNVRFLVALASDNCNCLSVHVVQQSSSKRLQLSVMGFAYFVGRWRAVELGRFTVQLISCGFAGDIFSRVMFY